LLYSCIVLARIFLPTKEAPNILAKQTFFKNSQGAHKAKK